jgi:hypothetical protein
MQVAKFTHPQSYIKLHIKMNIVFWDVATRGSGLNRHFEETFAVTCLIVISRYSTALKMAVIRSSETSVQTRATWFYIPEDDTLHSHHRENLQSFI